MRDLVLEYYTEPDLIRSSGHNEDEDDNEIDDADGYFEQFEPPEFVDAETENEDAETDIIQIDIEDDEEDEI